MAWDLVARARLGDPKSGAALKQRIEDGLPTPFWDCQPEYPTGLEWVIGAFHELSTDRPLTMGGPGPIPFASVAEYAKWYEIEEFDEFLSFVRALDAAYLEHAHARD
jgi:hypothetical protein